MLTEGEAHKGTQGAISRKLGLVNSRSGPPIAAADIGTYLVFGLNLKILIFEQFKNTWLHHL